MNIIKKRIGILSVIIICIFLMQTSNLESSNLTSIEPKSATTFTIENYSDRSLNLSIYNGYLWNGSNFRNQTDGSTPTGFSTGTIIPEKSGHAKSLAISSNLIYTIDSTVAGNFEFWIMFSDVTTQQWLYLYDSVGAKWGGGLSIISGNLGYRMRAGTIGNIMAVSTNTWYNLRMDYNTTSDKVSYYANGVLYYSNVDSHEVSGEITQFRAIYAGTQHYSTFGATHLGTAAGDTRIRLNATDLSASYFSSAAINQSVLVHPNSDKTITTSGSVYILNRDLFTNEVYAIAEGSSSYSFEPNICQLTINSLYSESDLKIYSRYSLDDPWVLNKNPLFLTEDSYFLKIENKLNEIQYEDKLPVSFNPIRNIDLNTIQLSNHHSEDIYYKVYDGMWYEGTIDFNNFTLGDLWGNGIITNKETHRNVLYIAEGLLFSTSRRWEQGFAVSNYLEFYIWIEANVTITIRNTMLVFTDGNLNLKCYNSGITNYVSQLNITIEENKWIHFKTQIIDSVQTYYLNSTYILTNPTFSAVDSNVGFRVDVSSNSYCYVDAIDYDQTSGTNLIPVNLEKLYETGYLTQNVSITSGWSSYGFTNTAVNRTYKNEMKFECLATNSSYNDSDVIAANAYQYLTIPFNIEKGSFSIHLGETSGIGAAGYQLNLRDGEIFGIDYPGYDETSIGNYKQNFDHILRIMYLRTAYLTYARGIYVYLDDEYLGFTADTLGYWTNTALNFSSSELGSIFYLSDIYSWGSSSAPHSVPMYWFGCINGSISRTITSDGILPSGASKTLLTNLELGFIEIINMEYQNVSFLDFNQNDLLVYTTQPTRTCFISLANQQNTYLNWENYILKVNGTQIYENKFLGDLGINYNVSIYTRHNTYINSTIHYVSGYENFISIILQQFSLKIFNQQSSFAKVNLTMDPNYPDSYTSELEWIEWISPNEIIQFRLSAGYYRLTIIEYEESTTTVYSYTLNGDDFLLITSDYTIFNVLENIENVNSSIGNQITNVAIDISNVNSSIANQIVNVDINLDNINSSLSDVLINQNLTLNTISSDLDALYIFSESNFMMLNNSINTTFIQLQNSIYLINNSIFTAIQSVETNLYNINNTISGNLSLILRQNDELTAIYLNATFGRLLDWTNASLNSSFIKDQITEIEIINRYRNITGEIQFMYEGKLETMLLSANNPSHFTVPKNASMRILSLETGEVLEEWQEVKDIDFGFFEDSVSKEDLDMTLADILFFVIIAIGMAAVFLISFIYSYYKLQGKNPTATKRKTNVKKRDDRDFLGGG